jgi:signal transduction histidine kinase
MFTAPGHKGYGIMIEDQELFAGYEQEIRRLNRLVQASLVINSTLELRSLLSVIMDHVADLTNAESASVMLYDHTTDQLRFVAATTNDPLVEELLNIPVPIEGSVAGAVLRENKVIVRNDLTNDPLHFRMVDAQSGFDTRSIIGVPMRYKDEAIGVLEAVNKMEGVWTDTDRRNMLILASQAAVAIKNAQVMDQLQRAYDEINQLDKLKNDFIAIASHELRTPLSVILGYATFLKEDAQGEVSAHASAVLNSALRMRNLIEDMTNLRYLKLGEAELVREHIPLVAIFQAAQNDVESMMEAKSQQRQQIYAQRRAHHPDLRAQAGRGVDRRSGYGGWDSPGSA